MWLQAHVLDPDLNKSLTFLMDFVHMFHFNTLGFKSVWHLGAKVAWGADCGKWSDHTLKPYFLLSEPLHHLVSLGLNNFLHK